MDEESLLSETIENDLKNREKNKSEPDASKIRRSAVSKVKETSINAIKKFASKIYKAVCMGWIPALIIIFMLIGMISFITSMPGLVQEEMMQKMIGFVDGFKEIVYGSDFYLSKLASDPDQTAQKNVLKYLDEMGIDPVGFGFASFYLKDSDGNVEFEIPGNTINDIRTIDGVFDGIDVEWIQDLGAIGDAQKYNRELTEERLRGDLILKYIISNERTFLIHDGDKIGNKDTDIGAIDKILGNYDLTGMIKTTIEGLDDSTITVDRENKQMVINSANFQGPFDLKKQDSIKLVNTYNNMLNNGLSYRDFHLGNILLNPKTNDIKICDLDSFNYFESWEDEKYALELLLETILEYLYNIKFYHVRNIIRSNYLSHIIKEERNNISLEYILKVINMADSQSVKKYKKEMIETSKQRIRAGYGKFY